MRKKAVSPASRRAYAQEVVGQQLCSQRQACRFLQLARSTFRSRGRPPTPAEEQLQKRLLALSQEHPRYGYRWIAALLRREGWRVGKRHIQKLRVRLACVSLRRSAKSSGVGFRRADRRWPRIGITCG